MTTSNQRVSTVNSESDRIGQYLATLSAASLGSPSACEGWRTSDVVAQAGRGRPPDLPFRLLHEASPGAVHRRRGLHPHGGLHRRATGCLVRRVLVRRVRPPGYASAGDRRLAEPLNEGRVRLAVDFHVRNLLVDFSRRDPGRRRAFGSAGGLSEHLLLRGEPAPLSRTERP